MMKDPISAWWEAAALSVVLAVDATASKTRERPIGLMQPRILFSAWCVDVGSLVGFFGEDVASYFFA
jgi:hypothetical protein